MTSISNSVTTDNGRVVFKNNSETYSEILADENNNVIFSDSINVLENADVVGSLMVGDRADFSNVVVVECNTKSSGPGCGALAVEGGVGVGKNLNVGDDVNIGGDTHINKDVSIKGTTHITNTMNANCINQESALVVDGGVVVKKKVCIGGNLKVNGSIVCNNYNTEAPLDTANGSVITLNTNEHQFTCGGLIINRNIQDIIKDDDNIEDGISLLFGDL